MTVADIYAPPVHKHQSSWDFISRYRKLKRLSFSDRSIANYFSFRRVKDLKDKVAKAKEDIKADLKAERGLV